MMPGGAVPAMLCPVAWETLEGWAEGSLVRARTAFLASANAVSAGRPELRQAQPASVALARLCRDAVAVEQPSSEVEAKRFFEAHFMPHRVSTAEGGPGFLTGYYEPVVEGALVRSDRFAAPVLDWPGSDIAASRDRVAWEAFSLSADARPVVWLRDWTELFLIQVQGSARVRLPDGTSVRLIYAGRNGAPYTSIGRRLIETGRIPAADMSLAVLKAWLRAHGQEPGSEARNLMHENRSYIFFRREPDSGAEGPIGGQGLPLQARCSIAVDRTLWSYGLPFWIHSREPVPGFGPDPLRGLFVAQDTGSAILGPARADLYLGSGEAAGAAAGAIRHAATFTVLLPRIPS